MSDCRSIVDKTCARMSDSVGWLIKTFIGVDLLLFVCIAPNVGVEENSAICINLISYIVLIRFAQVDIRIYFRVNQLALIISEPTLIVFTVDLDCYDVLLGVEELSLKCCEVLLRVKVFIMEFCEVLRIENESHNGVGAMLTSVTQLIYTCYELLLTVRDLTYRFTVWQIKQGGYSIEHE